jgi:hypothetical protein
MKWLNLETKVRTAPEFVGADPANRATWLCLMLFCAEHENGGTVQLCGGWGDRRWMQTCGVTKQEVHELCDLWRWVGDDLVIWGYPVERELEVSAKRIGGRLGGKRSGYARNKGCGEGELRPLREGLLERKERERKGIGKEEEGKSATTTKTENQVNECPVTEAVLKSAAVRIGLSDADVQDWLAHWRSMNWIVCYGGVERTMAARDLDRSLTNWRAKKQEIEHGGRNGKTGRVRVADGHYQAPGKPYAGIF